MSGADEVSAVEEASAVLPCTFTHPHSDRNLTGSVLWDKVQSATDSLVFNCTLAGPGRPRCDEVTQKAGGGRFKFVGNLREGDASIMVEPLRGEDSDKYRCRVVLSVGKFQSVILTQLTVEAADGNVSAVTGTEGGSATLPCVYRQSQSYPRALTVTWMRKDSHRHIVKFTPRADGSWAAENGATRFELVGDPKLGNALTRIKHLRVEDSDGYLCLVEFSKPGNYDPRKDVHSEFRSGVHPPYTHQYQREVRLRVTPGTYINPSIYILPILILLLMLCILLIIILWKKGVFSPIMGSARFSKRSAASPDDTGRGVLTQCDSECDNNVVSNSGEADQAESSTYASININSGKAKKPQADDEGGQKPEAANSEVIYAAVATSR